MREIKSAQELEERLKEKELSYGGLIAGVPRNKVSQFDSRTPEELRKGGMIGGDRMSHHGYAKKYAEYLFPMMRENKLETLVEVGILTGVGLAVWCDIFPRASVVGLDIDLDHMKRNMQNLLNKGAFSRNEPELYEFDQLVNNIDYLGNILKKEEVNVCIDDGLHSDESVVRTLESLLPYLAKEFTYFIEDNSDVHKKIRQIYPDLNIENEGELTIITRY